jgi:hypothetical protein
MRFGLSLPMQHPVGDDLSQRFAELLEMVRLARQAGFRHVSASQHYLAAPFQYMQPLPVLARVAAESGEMTLGTGGAFVLGPVGSPRRSAWARCRPRRRSLIAEIQQSEDYRSSQTFCIRPKL